MGRRCTAAQGGRAMTGAPRRITMIVLVLAVCAGPWGCAIKRPPMLQSPTDEVRAELKTIGLPVAGFVPEAQVDAPTSGKGMGALKGAGFGLAAGATPGLAIANAVGKGCGGGREIGALVCGAVLAVHDRAREADSHRRRRRDVRGEVRLPRRRRAQVPRMGRR